MPQDSVSHPEALLKYLAYGARFPFLRGSLQDGILQGTAEEGEPGTVCQVLQKGYMIGDKVLRHAMVKVVPE